MTFLEAIKKQFFHPPIVYIFLHDAKNISSNCVSCVLTVFLMSTQCTYVGVDYRFEDASNNDFVY